MELRYSTTRRDIARAYWRSLRRNRPHQLLWLVCVGFAFLNRVLRGPRTVLFGLELSVVMISRRNLNVFIVPTTAFPSMTAPDDAVAQWKAWQRAASKPG